MELYKQIALWNRAAVTIIDIRHYVQKIDDERHAYRLPSSGFLFAARGKAVIKLDDTEYRIQSFHVLHGPKGIKLSIHSIEDVLEYYLILYKAEYPQPPRSTVRLLQECGNMHQQQYGFFPSDPIKLRNTAELMVRNWQQPSELERFRAKSLFIEFVYVLLQQLQHTGIKPIRPDPVTQAIMYIHENYADPITTESLAELLDCTPRHLSRLFRKSEIGLSPLDYVIQYRMNKAKELLIHTAASVQEIADNVGYQDGFYFGRMFKKYMGLSPIRYREKERMKLEGPNMTFDMSQYSIVAGSLHRYIDSDNHIQSNNGRNFKMYKTMHKTTAVMLMLGLTLLMGACSGATGTPSSSNSPVPSNAISESGSPAAETGQPATTRTITHDLGQTEVTLNPQRVVVLEQGFTQLAAALQVKPVGVADDNKPDRLPQDTLPLIEGYTSVGTRSEPNLEVIRTLKPDLIIADSSRHTAIYKELAAIAPTIVFKNDTASYEETLAATSAIGEALGKEKETDALIKDHMEKISTLKQKINSEQKVLIIAPQEEDGNLFQVRTSSSFHPSFLVAAGANYALVDEKETNQKMTTEQLLNLDPDVLIILINEETSSVIEAQKDNPLWQQLKAAQNSSVHEVSLSAWSRQRSIPAVGNIMEEAAEILQ